MKTKIKMMLLLLASSIGFASAQQPAVMVSNKPGWHKIGETIVDFTKDRDEVKVLGADRFTALKFIVTDAPIDLQDLEVWFENGSKQDVQVRTPIQVGMESRVIDLPGAQRAINKIVFVYKTLENRKDEKAHVEIYGLKADNTTDSKTNEDRATTSDRERMSKPAMNTTPDQKDWTKVGEANADLTKDRDVINITNYNRFTSIRFYVTGADLEIMDLKVFFANGDKQDVAVRSMIKEGGQSRVIDLDGKTRDIKKIEFVYKTAKGQGKDRAHVEVWARGTMRDKTPTTGSIDNSDDIKNPLISKPAIELSDKKGWHRIAETTVSFKKEIDEVAIMGADRYAKLKFKVTEAGIVINSMTVAYEDGTKSEIELKSTFAEGQQSQLIDVPGREKDITKITFVYKSIPNQGKDKAHVEIWGLKTNADKSVGEYKD